MSDAKLQTRIRREQIAEAALQLVAGEGVKRLSIAAVARRVGLVASGKLRIHHECFQEADFSRGRSHRRGCRRRLVLR